MPVETDETSQVDTISILSGRTAKNFLRSGYDSLIDVADKEHVETADSKVYEDKRLKRWKQWLDERKKFHAKLGRVLKRTPGYLVMNSAEEHRAIVEDRLVFDYTQILAPPDRFRGSPAFFTIPFRIFPEIEAHPSPAERCEIPEIEYVSVPKVLQKYEKEVYGRSQRDKKKLMNNEYRKRRANELAKKIKYIQPHKPEAEDLLIIGTGYFGREEEEKMREIDELGIQMLLPVLTISKTDEFDEEPKVNEESHKFAIESLQITLNEMKLIRGNESSENTVDVNVLFECFIPPVQISKKIIRLKNSGTATVKYCWRRITHVDPKLPIKSEKDQFFFDKRSNIILPGQECELKFMVRPVLEGSFRETWELVTTPSILKPGKIIKFNLICHVFEFKHQEHFDEIRNRIAEKTKKSTVNRVVNYLLHCTLLYHSKHPITQFGKVTEEELFYINNLDPLTQQPKYEYKRQLVEELGKIYSNQTSKDWDYSVDTITKMINQKENMDERKCLFDQVNSALSRMTYSAITEVNPEFRKRQLVYNILLWTVNNIVDIATDLESKCHMKRINTDQNPVFDVSFQRVHLYSEPLPYKAVLEPLAKCFQRSNHLDEFREKYRPPLTYASRESILQTMSPMERHEHLKHLQQLLLVKARQFGLVISEGVVKSEMDAGVTFTSTVSPTDRFIDFDSSNCVLFNEILYLQVYTTLCKAVDDITAIIDACNLSSKNLPLVALERMLRTEKAADQYMRADTPKPVAPLPPSWKTPEEELLYAQYRSSAQPVLKKVADFGMRTTGARAESTFYLKDEDNKNYDGPPRCRDKQIPK